MEIFFPPSGSILHPLNDLGKRLVDAEKCVECSRQKNEILIRWNVLLLKFTNFFFLNQEKERKIFIFYFLVTFLSFKMKCKKGNFKGKAFLMMWTYFSLITRTKLLQSLAPSTLTYRRPRH